MAPSPSPEVHLDDEDARQLLDVAEASIRRAVGVPGRPPPTLRPALARPAAAFVTIHVDGRLNGCIGTVEASEPLGRAVDRLARDAALADPRLPPLRADQLARTDLEVSVLSPGEPLPAGDRQELLAALRPGRDGLVLAAGGRRALFLPDVWDQLPDPDDFVDHLLDKARLPRRPWPRGLRAERFATRAWHRRIGTAGTA